MASFKQETNKKWSVQFYYKDFTGKTQRKHKYGFNTKKDAKLWAEEFIRREEGNINMNFESLYEEYISCISQDIRESSLKVTNNPCKAAGTMGRKRKGNLGIWSQEDMDAFLEAVSDKTEIRYAFFLMYWTGIRLGELLALTVSDLDFDKGT